VKGVTIACDHAQAGNVTDAMQIINSGKYDIEKINNIHYTLEDLPRTLKETADPPEGFIRGAVVFD
jgi:threonine dehydrogenase-like Zn-dependent dehydrogenase|tara:strand:+ start:27485 stop:27682 length:198 start_codon:yes stop_codon:yes gene_type:complete